MKTIVVRGLNWLGDAIMSTPALLRLRQAWPESSITVVTPKKLAELYQHHPAVNDVLSFEPGESVWSVGKRIKEKNFSSALIFPNSPRSALESWLARVPERIGYTRGWRNLLLTRAVTDRPGAISMQKKSDAEVRRLIRQGVIGNPDLPESAHHLHHYLHLVAAVGGNPAPIPPLVFIAPAEKSQWQERWPLFQSTLPKVGLNPGAEYGPAKRWPLEKFAALASSVEEKKPVAWVVFGGKADQSTAAALVESLKGLKVAKGRSSTEVVDLAGRTTLRELAVGLAGCRVVVTNDTGPMHLGAAVGTPVVVPFGSTTPDLTAPGLPGDSSHFFFKSRVSCAPCFRRECPVDFRCLGGMDPVPLAQAVLDRLD